MDRQYIYKPKEEEKIIKKHILKGVQELKTDPYYKSKSLTELLQPENSELLEKLIIKIEVNLNIVWLRKYKTYFSYQYSRDEIKQFILNIENFFLYPENEPNYQSAIAFVQIINQLGPFVERKDYINHTKINNLKKNIKIIPLNILDIWFEIIRNKNRKNFLALKNYITQLKQNNYSNEEIIGLLQKEKNITCNIAPTNLDQLNKYKWWSIESFFETKEKKQRIQNNIIKFLLSLKQQTFSSKNNMVQIFKYLQQKPTPPIVEKLTDEEKKMLFISPKINIWMGQYHTWMNGYNAKKSYKYLTEAYETKMKSQKKQTADLFTKISSNS